MGRQSRPVYERFLYRIEEAHSHRVLRIPVKGSSQDAHVLV